MACLRKDNSDMNFTDVLFKVVQEYNSSIHTVIGKKSRDIFFGMAACNDPEKAEENRKKNSGQTHRKTKS